MSHVQMSDTEQDNFKTVFIVLVVCGKEALLYLLEYELSNLGLSFENFINLHQHDLFHFCYNTRACCQCLGGRVHPNSPRKKILSEEQLSILLTENCQQLKGHDRSRKSRFCCSPARTKLKADQLDITLLRCILINFTTIYTSDVNVHQAVDTILNYRNRYAHTKDARITDRDYRSQLLEIETNILKIAAFCKREDTMKQKLQELLTKHSDTALARHTYCALLHLEQKFETCMNQVEENAEQLRLSRNSDTGTRTNNIIAQTEARIGMHESDTTYVETSVVNTVDDHLKNHNVAVIVAKGGGGKTKLCLQLATIYKRKLYKPVLFADTQVIDKLDFISFEDKYFIILEDFFGRTNVDFDENVHHNTLDVLFDCVNSQTCNSKLLITIRNIGETYKHIFDKHKIFNNDIILNLDVQYCLTKDEREANDKV